MGFLGLVSNHLPDYISKNSNLNIEEDNVLSEFKKSKIPIPWAYRGRMFS